MHSKILASIGLIGTVMSASAFAEPPIQPGDTLESLSQAKVTTTVNGQPGSIQELVSSGQIKLVDPNTSMTPPPAPMNPADQGISNDQAIQPTAPQIEAPAPQAVPDTSAEQDMTTASIEQHPLAPNAALSTQQAEAALNEATAAMPSTSVETDPAIAAAPQLDSSANAPVNAIEPNSLPSPDAPAQALPEAPVNDPMN